MTEIYFRVTGIPGAQGSKKLSRWGAMIEASKKVHPWRQDVRAASEKAYKGEVLDCPVSVSIEFIFARPKAHFRTGKYSTLLREDAPLHMTSKANGDIDKLCRSTLDALSMTTGGNVFEDDSQVVMLNAEKRYAASKNDLPGAHISIISLA
jgi:crossover junction endodeoxyribonuclease RusA